MTENCNILYTGCSWTWGSELEGVPANHKYRLDNRFSGSHTNIAQNGLSNEGIVRNTIKYIENNAVDFAVVQFTIMDRYSIFNLKHSSDTFPNGKWIHLQAYMTDPKMKNSLEHLPARIFLKNFHNSVYAHNEFWRNVCLLENYLDNKGIPYYFMRVDMDQHVEPEQTNEYREASKNKNMFKLCDDLLGGVRKDGRKPNPNYCPNLLHLNPFYGGGHPSAKGHKMIADHLQGILPK
tara:strand:+ start:72 stop:779 length:708 start_codon:yes stop_codon:yes gene_type:complete